MLQIGDDRLGLRQLPLVRLQFLAGLPQLLVALLQGLLRGGQGLLGPLPLTTQGLLLFHAQRTSRKWACSGYT